MDAEVLRERARSIRWFHSIDLGRGVVTDGFDASARKLERLGLPDDLSGMSVLDIGAWDGFYSFECERRGAERVAAIDPHAWGGAGWASKEGFELARAALGSRVEDLDVALTDLAPETTGVFDMVLFLGILYHLRDPFEALERAASVCRRRLVVETHLDMLGSRRPAAAFYRGAVDGDASNWWGPNLRCLEEMLLTVGFREVRVASVDSLPRRVARSAYRLVRPPRLHWRMGRGVVHAVR